MENQWISHRTTFFIWNPQPNFAHSHLIAYCHNIHVTGLLALKYLLIVYLLPRQPTVCDKKKNLPALKNSSTVVNFPFEINILIPYSFHSIDVKFFLNIQNVNGNCVHSWLKGTLPQKSMWALTFQFSEKTTIVPFIRVWNIC